MTKSSCWLLAIALLFCLGDSQLLGQRFFGQPQRYYTPIRPQYNPYPNQPYRYPQQRPVPNYPRPNPVGSVSGQLPANFQPTQKRTLSASQLGWTDLPPGSMVTVIPLTAEQKREMAERDRQRQKRAAKRQQEIRQAPENKSVFPRLAGEFEKQQAILLSVSDWQPHHFGVFKQIVNKTRGYAKLVVMFNEKNMYDEKNQIVEVIRALAKDGTDYPHVFFLHHELDTIWLRDFGPQFAENNDGSPVAVDFYYDGMRPKDDDLPENWSKFTGTEFNHVPWTLQGGNLISNGNGLSITTTQIFQDNNVNFSAVGNGASTNNSLQEEREFIKRQLQKFCNIKQLAVLQPLENESTHHVDMFGTFLAADLFLMAKLDPRVDPRNARILDANARALSKVKVEGKPLRVERIQVPPRRGKHWSPYTNVILTDKLVLIPVLDSDPRGYQEQAVRVYKQLMPNHHVDTVDLTSMGKLEGSLHCLSCNVPAFAKLPAGVVSFKDALNGADYPKLAEQPRPKRKPINRRANEIVSRPVVERTKPVRETGSAGDSKPPTTKPSVDRTKPKPEAESQESKIARARIAVQSYRRTFGTKNGRHEYDCFVIGVDDNAVSLITVREKRKLKITLSFLDDDDRNWVVTNSDQINRFGPRVLDFVQNYELTE